MYQESLIANIRWILAGAIVIHALGIFITVFGEHQTHFGNYLFLVLGYSHTDAVLIEKITVSIFFATALLNLFHNRLYTLLPIAGYVFFEAWTGYIQGGFLYSDYILGAHALRYALPIALLTLICWPFRQLLSKNIRLYVTTWILRIAIAVVFAIHGLECLWGSPVFVDLIIGSANNILGIRVSESVALQIMMGIGTLDVIISLLILVKPWRTVLLWMAFWGTITAFSRMTALGTAADIEVLVRASHMIAPLVVYFIYYQPNWLNHFVTQKTQSNYGASV